MSRKKWRSSVTDVGDCCIAFELEYGSYMRYILVAPVIH